MPKMFVHFPSGVLTAAARSEIAIALTDLGMECERLADTDKVRRGVWVFFTEHGEASLFQGGRVASDPIIGLVIYALEGGLNDDDRRRIIAEATEILGNYIAKKDGPAPVYVVIQDVSETNWGMYGQQVSLASLR